MVASCRTINNVTRALLAFFALTFTTLEVYPDRARARGSWIRKSTALTISEIPKSSLILETIGAVHGHLTATGSYYSATSKELLVEVEGTVTSDNRFWPAVEMSVTNNLSNNWQRVNVGVRQEQSRALCVIKYGVPTTTFYFDLEPFRPFVGKMRFACLTLKTGEKAIFLMSDLQASSNASIDRTLDDEAVIYDGVHEVETSPPFVFLKAFFKPERIVGVFAYGSLEGKTVSLQGAKRNADGIWLSVECAVSNDLSGVWRIVGSSQGAGEAVDLSVPEGEINSDLRADLNIFKPFLGKFRYGRVAIGNNAVARFELTALLPRSGATIGQ